MKKIVFGLLFLFGCASSGPRLTVEKNLTATSGVAMSGTIPGARSSYDIQQWVDIEKDCGPTYDPRVAGPAIICDLSPAFNSIMADANATIEGAWPLRKGQIAPTIYIPAGVFELLTPVAFCRAVNIIGQGGGMSNTTVLRVPRGQNAFKFRFYYECKDEGNGEEGSNGSMVEKLDLVSYTKGNLDTPGFGLEVQSRITVRDVAISGFVQGIRVRADVHNSKTNANVFFAERVRLISNEHAGIWFSGGDSNAGGAVAIDSGSNCQLGTKWKETLGPCANIVEKSFLGNTFVIAATASAKDRITGEVFPGYLFEGASQRSVCVGCYAEHDQLVSPLSPSSNVVGGLSLWSGPGSWWQGPRLNSLIIQNTKDPNNIVETRFGIATNNGGSFIDFVPDPLSTIFRAPLRLKLEKSTMSYRLDVANLDSAVVLRIGATTDALGGYAGLWLGQLPYFGNIHQYRLVTQPPQP